MKEKAAMAVYMSQLFHLETFTSVKNSELICTEKESHFFYT